MNGPLELADGNAWRVGSVDTPAQGVAYPAGAVCLRHCEAVHAGHGIFSETVGCSGGLFDADIQIGNTNLNYKHLFSVNISIC